MKKLLFSLICLVAAVGLFANPQFDKNYSEKESETIRKTLRFQDVSGSRKILVDNLFGYIHVEGTSSDVVELLVEKTIKARTKDKLQTAKEEISLDISEDGNTIDLYVNGPFRWPEEKKREYGYRNPGYAVHYDFTLKVPKKVNLTLKTVTEGDISVQNIEGDFEIKNVNGQIVMTSVSGSGEAETANGKVEVTFTENPHANCSFKTLNGDVKILFQPGLSADFWLKTFTGEAFSAFPGSYLPPKPGKEYRKDGKFVYEGSNMTGLRIGRGGPEIKMDTMTGDLLIEKFK